MPAAATRTTAATQDPAPIAPARSFAPSPPVPAGNSCEQATVVSAPRSFGALSNVRATVGNPVSFAWKAPAAKAEKDANKKDVLTSPQGTTRVGQAGPARFSFTTKTNQLPERGLVSAQSLATMEFSEVVPDRAVEGKPRTRGVGELGGKMEISVNILNGASFSVLMAPTETGKDLKRKIETNSQIPPDQQQLVFAGKQLRDDRTMYDYGITKNCVVFCVPKNGQAGVAPGAGDKTRQPSARRRQKTICPCQACPCPC